MTQILYGIINKIFVHDQIKYLFHSDPKSWQNVIYFHNMKETYRTLCSHNYLLYVMV